MKISILLLAMVAATIGCVSGAHLTVTRESNNPEPFDIGRLSTSTHSNGPGSVVAHSDKFTVYGSLAFIGGQTNRGANFRVVDSNLSVGERRISQEAE